MGGQADYQSMSNHDCREGEYTLRLHVEKLPEGVYLATSKDLPGLVAQGDSFEETIEIARDVARQLVASYCEHSDRLPRAIKPVRSRMEVDTAFAL